MPKGIYDHSKRKKQFCPKGHDTFVMGRYKDNECKVCDREQQREYRENDPERAREIIRSSQQNNPDNDKELNWRKSQIINPDGSPFKCVDRERLFQLQSGKCKICGKHQSELKQPLQVDHDHRTGIVRGLLCLHHNAMLGLANDSLVILAEAQKYLKE